MTADSNTISVRVFRIWLNHRTGGSWYYCKGLMDNYKYSTVDDPLLADTVGDKSPEQIVKAMAWLKTKAKNAETVELVDVEVKTSVTPVDFNEGDLLEHRRKVALSKLDDLDVEALGIEKMAAYNKLKFHGEQ